MTWREKIQKLEKEIRRLKEMVYKDELTKLYNRRGFQEESGKFIREVLLSKNNERRKSFLIADFGLIVFDIDNFKKLNDQYGHQAGDIGLKMLSDLISERVREIDLVARWGGEEIIVGLVGASEKDAYLVADDIRERLEKKVFIFKAKKIKFTVSGGVASLSQAKNFEELFKKADAALYQAKKSGKNMIVKYSEMSKRK